MAIPASSARSCSNFSRSSSGEGGNVPEIEMTATAKQALSHRARAFARLLERLRPEN